MRRIFHIFLSVALIAILTQISTAEDQQNPETEKSRPFVSGGADDKPFINRIGEGITGIGGYAETHFRFERKDGVNDEITFVPKRFNIFTYTAVNDRVRVASELEFEEGTEEINLELAMIDFEIAPYLTFRSGIILSPLGRFNLAHDSPANDLTDRPLVSTEIIPTALSEAGMGFYGAFFPTIRSRITYEIYAVNGFNDGVLIGSDEGTRISAGKGNFEDNNKNPAFVGRVAISPDPIAEIGVSGHTGVYNVHDLEDLPIDDQRSLTIFALDGEIKWKQFELIGEYARASIDVPQQLTQIFSDQQQGFYLQANVHFLEGLISVLPRSVFTGVVRYGVVDFDTKIDGDSHRRLTLGLNFRPIEDTVFKLDYQYNWARDRFNIDGRSASLIFSTATYF